MTAKEQLRVSADINFPEVPKLLYVDDPTGAKTF
jgi:hypothetical protein